MALRGRFLVGTRPASREVTRRFVATGVFRRGFGAVPVAIGADRAFERDLAPGGAEPLDQLVPGQAVAEGDPVHLVPAPRRLFAVILPEHVAAEHALVRHLLHQAASPSNPSGSTGLPSSRKTGAPPCSGGSARSSLRLAITGS